MEQNDKGIEEETQNLMNEDGPWIKVGSNAKQSRYQLEKVQEQQGQFRGRLKLWEGSDYQSNHGQNLSTLGLIKMVNSFHR